MKKTKWCFTLRKVLNLFWCCCFIWPFVYFVGINLKKKKKKVEKFNYKLLIIIIIFFNQSKRQILALSWMLQPCGSIILILCVRVSLLWRQGCHSIFTSRRPQGNWICFCFLFFLGGGGDLLWGFFLQWVQIKQAEILIYLARFACLGILVACAHGMSFFFFFWE